MGVDPDWLPCPTAVMSDPQVLPSGKGLPGLLLAMVVKRSVQDRKLETEVILKLGVVASTCNPEPRRLRQGEHCKARASPGHIMSSKAARITYQDLVSAPNP